jgi:hypothetical protein
MFPPTRNVEAAFVFFIFGDEEKMLIGLGGQDTLAQQCLQPRSSWGMAAL